MKNFTNNFKQFTSRLSARWLLVALMFLLGTSGAWAQSWYTLSSDAYFYFNDNVSWTSSTKKAVLLIGRKWNYGSQGVGSNAYSMTNISNTKLQYYKVSAWGSGDGGKYTDIAILSGNSSDGWSGWEGNAVSTRRTYGSKRCLFQPTTESKSQIIRDKVLVFLLEHFLLPQRLRQKRRRFLMPLQSEYHPLL